MQTIKEEHVRHTEYEDIEDGRRQSDAFISEVYAKKRIHSAHGYAFTAEFKPLRRFQIITILDKSRCAAFDKSVLSS